MWAEPGAPGAVGKRRAGLALQVDPHAACLRPHTKLVHSARLDLEALQQRCWEHHLIPPVELQRVGGARGAEPRCLNG
jgi:hypothetical protein